MDVNEQLYLRNFHDGSVSVPAGAALFLSEPACSEAAPFVDGKLPLCSRILWK